MLWVFSTGYSSVITMLLVRIYAIVENAVPNDGNLQAIPMVLYCNVAALSR